MQARGARARERWLLPTWYERLWDAVCDLELPSSGRSRNRLVAAVVAAAVVTVALLYVAAVLIVRGA